MAEPHSGAPAAPTVVTGPRLFRYVARERVSGRSRSGETRGIDAYTVRTALRLAGLDVEQLEPLRERTLALPASIRRQLQGFRRDRRKAQRADIMDALSSLLGAGITLERALSDLAESVVRSAGERRMLGALRDGIRDGQPLDVLASQHPEWFDPVDVALIAVGQRSGELPRILGEISKGHQHGADTSHKLIMALTYPALLLVVALGVVAFIGNQTLPQLLKILSDAHVQPPLLTVFVATLGQALVRWWWLSLLACVGMGWGVRAWLRQRPPHRWPHTWLATLPLARAQQRIRVARIALVLGQLLRNGVPLAEALTITAVTSGNRPLRELLETAADGIARGESLSAHIGRSRLLDPEFAQVLQIGEQAGELPDMCQRIAERYQRAAQRAIEQVAALAEPLAIVIMAILVGVVVMAAILPLISLGDIL